jgi:hypothetical protein
MYQIPEEYKLGNLRFRTGQKEMFLCISISNKFLCFIQ